VLNIPDTVQAVMKKVLLFLPQGFEVLEASAFIDVMGWNLLEGDGTTRLHTCGLRREVVSSFDQRCIVDHVIDEVDAGAFDALAIPGGFEQYGYYTDAFDERFLQLIRVFNGSRKPIATVCVAALPVAKSGLLAGKEGTTYPSQKRRELLKSYDVQVVDRRIVITGNIITSLGPSTAIDVGLMLLATLTSEENANAVGRLMGFR